MTNRYGRFITQQANAKGGGVEYLYTLLSWYWYALYLFSELLVKYWRNPYGKTPDIISKIRSLI